MKNLELICFNLISNTGMAKSAYIEAVRAAKEGNIQSAENLIKEGDQLFIQAHTSHAQLIQQEAAGQKVEVTLLLTHAEDQLMNTETIKILVLELIEVYKILKKE